MARNHYTPHAAPIMAEGVGIPPHITSRSLFEDEEFEKLNTSHTRVGFQSGGPASADCASAHAEVCCIRVVVLLQREDTTESGGE